MALTDLLDTRLTTDSVETVFFLEGVGEFACFVCHVFDSGEECKQICIAKQGRKGERRAGRREGGKGGRGEGKTIDGSIHPLEYLLNTFSICFH